MHQPASLLLGLSAPACVLVAHELLRRDCCDPEHPLLVVVPTRDAVRLLREQLAVCAARGGSNGAFICPSIIAASQLGTHGCVNAASPWLQQAALFCVLRRERARFPHLAPQAEQWSEGDWLARAGQFRRLFTTLSHEGVLPLGPDASAAQALAQKEPLWQEIFSLYPLYLEELHRYGLCDPAEGRGWSLPSGTRVILACVPSLSEHARQLLEQSGHEVEVWLHTDELHEGPGWFDAWGRPGEHWLATPSDDVLGLEDGDWQQRFLICADVERMAEETVLAAGRAGGSVAVGVCEPGMESAVAQSFIRHGACAVRPRGIPFTASGWHRLLLVLTRFAELMELGGSRATYAPSLPAEPVCDLLRNPIVTDGLHLEDAAGAALAADKLRVRCLPASFGQMRKLAGDSLGSTLDALASWLACLDSTPALLMGLRQLAGEQFVAGAPDALKDECALAAQFTEQMDEACRSLLESPWVHELSPLSTLHLLTTAGAPAHSGHPSGALSLRGWLELTYAPEETLLLAGLHDDIIPERWPASPYLTPQVIEALGLPRDDARAARDAYLLRSLYRCRPGRVQAFFSLLNARRDPLFPSSTFFRLTPQRHLAQLAGHFFDHSQPCPATSPAAYDSAGWHYRELPLPVQSDNLPRLARLTLAELGLPNPMAGKTYSPSALRQFLACPLRFWVAKLNGVRDERLSPTQRDLDAREVGNCLHDALEAFVKRYPKLAIFEAAHAEDSGHEEAFLLRLQREMEADFDAAYERRHGKAELMPQQFQCESMKRRLAAYAHLHMKLWQQGWECALDAGGRPMVEYEVSWELFGHPLNFRVDRIDRRRLPDGGWEYRVIDYKTGHIESCYKNHLEELPKPPARPDLHLLDAGLEPAIGPGRGKHAELRWKDLQLPLYTAWARDYFAGNPVHSAYIHLSRRAQETRVVAWGDSEKDPVFFEPRLVPANAAYPQEVMAEPLFDNALRWIRFGLNALAEGRCLASAEMLAWKAPRVDHDVFGDILKLEPLAAAFLTFPDPLTD